MSRNVHALDVVSHFLQRELLLPTCRTWRGAHKAVETRAVQEDMTPVGHGNVQRSLWEGVPAVRVEQRGSPDGRRAFA